MSISVFCNQIIVTKTLKTKKKKTKKKKKVVVKEDREGG